MAFKQHGPVTFRRLAVRTLFAWVGALYFILATTPDAVAGERRARLSEDLVRRIASGDLSAAPVIITGTREQVEAIAARHGLTVRKRLTTGAVLEVGLRELEALAGDPEVDSLAGDHPVRANMAVTNVAVGADQAWAGLEGLSGVTGAGVGIAVIDSGIAIHPALTGRVVASKDFTVSSGRGDDQYGHGTHVAGIIAAASRADGAGGVAPGAHLVNLKVLGADGSGRTSDVIAAIDYAIEHKDAFKLRVINLSLGHPVVQSWRDDPLCQAVERAYRAGLLVVASAGNLGKTEDGKMVLGSITSPGNSPFALTVGALNTKGTTWRSDDVVATYSSKGPTRFDLLIKPDLVAPGNKIQSLAAPGSTLVREHPELVTGTGQEAKLQLSGTSMAAAVVSGAAALLIDETAGLSPLSVRAELQYASSRVDSGLIAVGTGALNVAAALALHNGDHVAAMRIAGERVDIVGTVVIPTEMAMEWAHTILWSNMVVWSNTLVWSNTVAWSNTVIWSNTLVWSNGLAGEAAQTLVWSNGDTVVWSNDDTLVWSNDEAVVWGADDTLVWSYDNTVVWSYDDTVVWSE